MSNYNFEVSLKKHKDLNGKDGKGVYFWLAARDKEPDSDRLGNFFAFEGKLVQVNKADKTHFAKAYAPTPADKATWPSGLEATQCFMCQKRPTEAHFAVRQIILKIGPEGKKK